MGRQDWRTPPSVFRFLGERFGPFDCDVAADEHNHLCPRYLTVRDGPPDPDGWGACNFCNPTFGNVAPFMQAAVCAETVMLSHANPNSTWFQFAIRHAALYCPDKRINYWHPDEDPRKTGADRDTVIWHFGGEPGRIYTIEIPDHRKEIRRLWEESNGQQSLWATGMNADCCGKTLHMARGES
jgi:hypothetical protein